MSEKVYYLPTKFTQKEINYIKENYQKSTNAEIAEILHCKCFDVASVIGYYKLTRRQRNIQLQNDEYFENMSRLNLSRYDISNYGNIRKVSNGTYLKHQYSMDGYHYIRLTDDNGIRSKNFYYIHRLVALMFIHNDNPEIKIEVNHIDGNKDNLHVSNLEWVTPSQNINHSFKTGLNKTNKYSTSDIEMLCQLLENGINPNDIIKQHPQFSRSIIYKVKYKKTRTNISKKYNF